MAARYLVMGDNHGDTESLRRVLDNARGESFDAAIHVGDFTRAMRHDDPALGADQLSDVEPVLREFDALADHGLLWVWGNQDLFGDIEYDIDVGTEIPRDGAVTVGGQRFTADPERVVEDTILVTHMEHWRLLDHFAGRAHFCGNTHLGRRLGRRLNSAFLHVTDPETSESVYGGYFVVEVGPDTFDVEMRSIGDLHRRECATHRERGVQFLASDYDCMYDLDDRVLLREMAASAFYGLTGDDDTGGSTVEDNALTECAVGLWDDPPARFEADFRTYLDAISDDRYAPLARADDGGLEVAEDSYAY
jgi:predicted phosphodiesterase